MKISEKLELGTYDHGVKGSSIISIAISLKRIADMMERGQKIWAPEELSFVTYLKTQIN
jgi:hypothetical protein